MRGPRRVSGRAREGVCTVTTNQTRAVLLAREMSAGRASTTTISDNDWNLLLLAAGLNHAASSPLEVARRVLATAYAGTGYFWPGDRPCHPQPPAGPAPRPRARRTRGAGRRPCAVAAA